ncbi:MAG: hypothetical protein ABIY50_08240 [Ignavibacteria bacterium]
MKIDKTGKTKEELLRSLDSIKDNLKNEISSNNVEIEKITDGYSIKAEKKIIFVKFWVNAAITAGDGYYEITWETNAPEGKVAAAIDKVKDTLEKV